MPPPRKKDRLRAVCPRCGNNFRQQRRSAAGSQICRAKAARTRAQKQSSAKPEAVCRLRPCGNGGHRVRGGVWEASHWAHAGAGGTPGRKNSPGEGQELCADCAHGRAAGNKGVWYREVTARAARRGRGHARAQKQSPAEAGSCAQTAPMGERQAMGVSGAGKHHTGHPPGQRARPGAKQSPARARSYVQAAPMGERRAWGFWCREASHWAPPGQGARPGAKQPPAGAGGCLNAGYGCYLPRAIRVIWMHRVGSTARPRIMPS